MTENTFTKTWAIIELLGHRKLAGKVTEVQVAGKGFLQVDVVNGDKGFLRTDLINPDSIYAIHPCDEDLARASRISIEPIIHKYELRQLIAPQKTELDSLPNNTDEPIPNEDYMNTEF